MPKLGLGISSAICIGVLKAVRQTSTIINRINNGASRRPNGTSVVLLVYSVVSVCSPSLIPLGISKVRGGNLTPRRRTVVTVIRLNT